LIDIELNILVLNPKRAGGVAGGRAGGGDSDLSQNWGPYGNKHTLSIWFWYRRTGQAARHLARVTSSGVLQIEKI